MNNRDSLRTQIIAAMEQFNGWDKYRPLPIKMQRLFDEAIMPVLDSAMKAGELLVHRATIPPQPVNLAIIDWLQQCCDCLVRVHDAEDTVSKRQLLTWLYQLEHSAINALAEARAINTMDTTSQSLGKLLSGQSFPTKG